MEYSFDTIQEGDTVGRSNFPYNFLMVIIREPDLLVVQKIIDGRIYRGVLPREVFDKGIYVKYTIEEAEIIENKKLSSGISSVGAYA